MKATYTYFILTVLSIIGFIPNLQAQPGSNDATFNTFNPAGINFDYAGGVDGLVWAIAVQADGKIIIGGLFSSYNGTPRNNIARLNPDGSLDTSFNPGTGPNNWIRTISATFNGKIIIGGEFTSYNAIPRNRIARLNSNGSLDTSFDQGTGANNTVFTTTIQSNGKIIIGGDFTSYSGTSRVRVARLNANGSLDTDFTPQLGPNGTIHTTALTQDGKIIIGGDFNTYNGTTKSGIARLNSNGTLDTSFAGIGAAGGVYTVALQSDGKVIIAGDFWNVNYVNRRRLARLNTDGSLDTEFNIGNGPNSWVRTTSIQPDGKIIIAGDFTSFNSIPTNYLARLNSDGSFDSSFNTGTGTDNPIYASAMQLDEKIILGGDFTSFNGTMRKSFIQLYNNGVLANGFNIGTGANAGVLATLEQPDGKIIIAGQFTSFNAVPRNYLVRLNADGSSDINFNIGSGANGSINTVLRQSNGQIVIVGGFTTFNGVTRNRIARLNEDGSLDSGFNPGTGANSAIVTAAIQSDGKMLIGGSFTSYSGTGRNRVARLNANGSLDASFNPGAGTNSTVHSLVWLTNGKILIGGAFTSYSGTAINRIARLNSDGSLDASFNPGTGPNATVRNVIQIIPTEQIVIVGNFLTFNGTSRNRIARLNSNGSLDTGFNPGTGANNTIFSATFQPDGKTVICGDFTSFNGTSRNRITRLNFNGSIDTGFNPGIGANNTARTVALQIDGKILIGGDFTSYNGVLKNRFARLNSNGSLDESVFGLGTKTGANGIIMSAILQPDQKIIIGGAFSSFDGVGTHRIARLNIDGSLDNSFNSGLGANGTIFAAAIQPDGKILIGGEFTYYNGIFRKGIARLNADGSLDNSFSIGNGADNTVNTIVVQPDGKIVIGGLFTKYGFTDINRIARLNANGSIDTGFDPGTGVNSTVHDAVVQPDGKIIITGAFIVFNGITRNRIARLNTNGSLDTSFNPGTGLNNTVMNVNILPNGKIIVAGNFTLYNGTTRNRIARVNANGSLDPNFDPNAGASDRINAAELQPDGKILIGGNFTSYNGTTRNRVARLNANGSLDTSINPIAGAGNSVRTVALQNDGKIIIGGQFTSYYGVDRNRIARINGGECTTVQGTDIISACASHTWIDGIEYTSNNNTATFLFEGAAQNGCDSLVTLNLTINQISTPPTTINSLYNLCHGGSTQLEIQGGSLTDGAQWEWFSGSCNSTPIGTGSTLEVSPNANTTYYARASQGTACPPSDCESVVVNLPATSTNLSVDGEHATCFVNQNGWVHFYNSAGNLIASIKSNGQDLGNVLVTSHIANSPYQSASCTEENNASFFQANLQRTFVITPEYQPTNPVQVRLYILDDEIAAYQTAALATTQNPHDDITTISDLHMTKVSGGTGSGDPTDFCGSNATAEFLLQDASGNINDAATGLSGFTATSYLEFTIDAFSEFFPMNANNSALPVSLTHFSANCLGEKIGIQWTTASEFNASHYVLESSRDGFIWNEITKIDAAGTTNQMSNYNHAMSNTGNVTYFRLVQIDNDGQQEIFGPISSNCTLEYNLMTVYPNPATENFTVLIQTAEVFENAHIELVDLSGRVILSQKTNLNAGSTMLNFDVKSIQPGAYIIRLKGEQDKFTPIRVVKL